MKIRLNKLGLTFATCLSLLMVMLVISSNTSLYADEIEQSENTTENESSLVLEYDFPKPKERLKSFIAFPADTSSPRDTLESFMYLTQSYYDFIKDDGYTKENFEELRNIEFQMTKLFDLRDIPPSIRENTSMEAAVYLRETFERIELPPLYEIPDQVEMASIVKEGLIPRYRIPGTVIEIEKVSGGPYADHYQFSKDTLTKAFLIYNQADDYPLINSKMEGFYEAYFLTPGPMIPLNWIRSLPIWMAKAYAGQTLWQWALLFISVMLVFVFLLVFYWFIRKIAKGLAPLPKNFFFLVRPIVGIVSIYELLFFLDKQVFLTGTVLHVVTFVVHLFALYFLMAITIIVSRLLAEIIITSDRFKGRSIDQHLIRIGIKLLSIVAAAVILIQGLHKLGFSLATLLAGAGVTGLAIALAAQDTLKNIFGSFMLLLDKPFVVGQRVKFRDHDGTIEEIGLRSTRIRTLTGHLVSIPNDDMSKEDIVNIGRRNFIRRDFEITITYDTPVEKIEKAVQIVKEILSVPEGLSDEDRKKHPNEGINRPDYPPRVFFDKLNSDSLNIKVSYWYHPPAYWDYLAHSEIINVQIMKRFRDEAIEFAFPSQTMYLAGDEKRAINIQS